jgi:hypothetical protein
MAQTLLRELRSDQNDDTDSERHTETAAMPSQTLRTSWKDRSSDV